MKKRNLVFQSISLLCLSFALPVFGEDLLLKVPELPKQVGQAVAIEIPGLPTGAKKLELALAPGLGAVQSFLIGKYEVTQGQYEAIMGRNPSTFKKGPDYPVELVDYH